MELDITETREIRLTEIYNPIILQTSNGRQISICERDGAFEINLGVGNQAKSRPCYSLIRII